MPEKLTDEQLGELYRALTHERYSDVICQIDIHSNLIAAIRELQQRRAAMKVNKEPTLTQQERTMTMNNDLVRLACERACESFGSPHTFNAASFASAMADLAGVRDRLDGKYVRALLAGRDDIIPLSGGAHYNLVGYVTAF